ncbi:MAG TPA: hypothetical protein VFW33_16475, partial [Gemmataceae bacterium]|nr:hypothetical protein [Gemmataceae bacterium]
PSLPVLFLVGGYAAVPLRLFPALVVVSLLTVLGVGAVGILSAVASKHAGAAVVGAYALVGVGGLAVRLLPLPALDPFEVLALASDNTAPGALTAALGKATLAWSTVAVGCFLIAVWRLRPDGLRQMHGPGLSRSARARARPPVEDDPIRWKENHIDGLAVLPLLRRLPRPLGVVVAIVVSAGLSACSAVMCHPQSLEPDADPFIFQGVLFVLAATLVVTVRASGAITSERERNTWDSLRLTPLKARAFLSGKLHGLFDAVLPYYVAYLVPALLLSVVGGPVAFIATMASVVIVWPLIYYAAACGLRASSGARNTWRSLLAALFAVYVMSWLLCWATSCVAALGFVALVATLAICAGGSGGELVAVCGAFVIPLLCAIVLALFGRSQLRAAEARALTPPDDRQPSLYDIMAEQKRTAPGA